MNDRTGALLSRSFRSLASLVPFALVPGDSEARPVKRAANRVMRSMSEVPSIHGGMACIFGLGGIDTKGFSCDSQK